MCWWFASVLTRARAVSCCVEVPVQFRLLLCRLSCFPTNCVGFDTSEHTGDLAITKVSVNSTYCKFVNVVLDLMASANSLAPWSRSAQFINLSGILTHITSTYFSADTIALANLLKRGDCGIGYQCLTKSFCVPRIDFRIFNPANKYVFVSH